MDETTPEAGVKGPPLCLRCNDAPWTNDMDGRCDSCRLCKRCKLHPMINYGTELCHPCTSKWITIRSRAWNRFMNRPKTRLAVPQTGGQ